MKHKMIDFLLQNANPSIRLRVKKEVLGDITEAEEKDLQAQILDEKILRLIAEKQLPNGWIGLGFHGGNKNAGQFDNQETGTKYMGEKGLHGSELLNRAMDAFVTTELTDLCYETRGHYFSEFKIPACGQNTIRSACIARAGYSDVIDITPQINVALESFRRVTEVDSIFEVTRPWKQIRLFNENERWPCRYHIETLAFTDSWKTEENIKMLAASFKRLMRTDRPEIIKTPVACWVGHAVGPLWYLNEGYSIASDAMNQPDPNGDHLINFEKVEWLCRAGLYNHLPELREEVEFIRQSIDENGVCNAPFYKNEFRGWGPYSGLQLETDWRTAKRRICDVTFRALLVLHYADN